ncbi:MAG: EamA family transporter [Opitutae bacterium]|nr:EamA family transporter [Opitutae bacterium]
MIPWVAATLLSAFFLGLYDLGTKHAVRDNAVLPVLFFANLCSATVWGALIAIDRAGSGGGALPAILHVAPMTGVQHFQIFLKSLIVGVSWVCSYFAVKHLPVSIASPIRATGPVWTLLGALLVLGERPSGLEMLGVAVTLASFVGLGFAGAREGIHFHRDKWIWWLVGGTLTGALSGLYDKFLLGRQGFTAATVQAWFAIYLALLFLPLALAWKFRLWQRNVFHWRWSILVISFGLLVADFLYFDALRNPDALVSLVSSLRRGSTLVAFAGGLWLFGEKNGLQKLPAVLGVLAGIALTLLG